MVDEHTALKERCAEIEAKINTIEGVVGRDKYEEQLHELKCKKIALKDRMMALVRRYHPTEADRINPHLYVCTVQELRKLLKQAEQKSSKMHERGAGYEAEASRQLATAFDVDFELKRRIGVAVDNDESSEEDEDVQASIEPQRRVA